MRAWEYSDGDHGVCGRIGCGAIAKEKDWGPRKDDTAVSEMGRLQVEQDVQAEGGSRAHLWCAQLAMCVPRPRGNVKPAVGVVLFPPRGKGK